MTQLPKEPQRLRPAPGARATVPRAQETHTAAPMERSAGAPHPQACSPRGPRPCRLPGLPAPHPHRQAWSLPSRGGEPAAAWGACQGPGPMPGVSPKQPEASQGSAPQPMRKALSPCPLSQHRAETCPRQHLPQAGSGQHSDAAMDPGDLGKCPAFTDSPALWPEAGGHGRAPSRFSHSQLSPGTATMCEGSEQSPGATARGGGGTALRVSSRPLPQPPTPSPPRTPQRLG